MNRGEYEGLEISLDMGWVMSLEKKVSDTQFRDRNREPTIYKVPDILKRVDPQAYEPLLISLGPYHRDKPHLKAMDQLKWKYLKFVLEQNQGLILVDYLDTIKKLETRARDAYSEEVNMSSNSFVEMMLLDGCFVMLTIRDYSMAMKISKESTLWTQTEVLEDIFKLENQLPFFLLETLYKSAFPNGPSFRNLTCQFICIYTSSGMEHPPDDEAFHHIIHLFLSCIDPTKNNGNENQSSQQNLHVPNSWIPTATVLAEAGIHFKEKKGATSFLDITFHNGNLEIPQRVIDDGTNSFLRNLIAYEQCSMSMSSKHHVTSYTLLMDHLIDSAADMELLQQDDIIINSLGDNQEVATLFNKIGLYVVSDNGDRSYLADVVKAIKKHRNTRCNKWRAWLNREYFVNPWAAISLIGAIVLFVLTVIQTIYAALSYMPSSKTIFTVYK